MFSARIHNFPPVRHLAACWFSMCLTILLTGLSLSFSAEAQENTQDDGNRSVPRSVLSEPDWLKLDKAVDRGLRFLASEQQQDGSFQRVQQNEPGISALCLMAFLSRGHLPEQGVYGERISRTANYLLSSQQPDGLIARQRQAYHAPYNHGISSLVISELYGISRPTDDAHYRTVIRKAMEFTSHRYSQPKASDDDEGGWRYLRRHAASDSDLSVTSWNVMFLRSARNAGFEVNRQLVDEALAYMERLYDPSVRTFRYELHTDEPAYIHSRGMAGAGVLSMSLAGRHDSEMAQHSAAYILSQQFDQYVRPVRGEQYPCYSAFYCSHAMFQMGGKYWQQFYPQLVQTLLAAQRRDGSWMMQQGTDVQYGVAYMTAMSILALTPPYQAMPIFQR